MTKEAMKQEPVAWLVEFENGEQELHFERQSVGETQTPLYPPAQRTWVGLTEQQALDCFSPNPVIHSKNIEAKLKELNT